jgi:hypothetical protein
LDPGTILTVATSSTGLLAGAWGGSRYGKQQALADAANASSMSADLIATLQAKIGILEEQNASKDESMSELFSRIDALENLVTQKAEVEAVHTDLIEVKEIVSSIASKVGA